MSTANVSAFEELNAIQRTRYTVGNAGDESVEKTCNGHVYRWLPQERKEIADQMDYPRDARTQKPNMRVPPIPIPTMGAFNVVKFLFSEEEGLKGAEAGLYLVRGDAGDRAREALAREAYVNARVNRARRKQKEWAARGDAWVPGDPVLAAPQHLRDDLAFLAKQESGLGDRKAFWSKYGDFESDDRDEVINYMRAMWPAQYAAHGDLLVIARDQLAARPQAAPPVRKPVAAQVAQDLEEMAPAAPAIDQEGILFVTAQARELGETLTDEEMRALLMGDNERIEAIVGRLAAIKAEKE